MTDEISRGRRYEQDTIEVPPGTILGRLAVPPSITCPRCGMTSWNETDAEQGNCHDWTTARR